MKITCDCGQNDTSCAKSHLGVVKVHEESVLVFDDKFQLNTVGHNDNNEAENGHDGLLGWVTVRVQ